MNYEFQYDNAGNITSYSYENEVIPVEYNPAEKKYHVEYPDSNELTMYLNDAGDIKKLIYYDAIEDETNTINILFDGSKKGGLTNTNMINVHIFLVTGLPIIALYSTFMTHVPVTSLTMTETGKRLCEVREFEEPKVQEFRNEAKSFFRLLN